MRKLIDKLVGSHRKEAVNILKRKELILGGTMIAIDPSSLSMGYAVFKQGKLVENNVITAKGNIGFRLNKLCEMLPDISPDVVIVEKVRSNTGHIYLTWSTGAAVARYPAFICEVAFYAWKKNVGADYEKSDARDALEIGNFAITLCKEDEEV